MRLWVLPAFVAILIGSQAFASQLVGHMYAAMRIKEEAPPSLQALLNRELDAYLAGSAGPDIAYTTHYVQIGVTDEFGVEHFPAGTESHRIETGRLAMNLLATASSDREKAFALGWLTHYCVDSRIHPLVNRFGGYFEVSPTRHKKLEMVECEHAFRRAAQRGFDVERFVVNAAAVPAEMVQRAFAKTYPIPKDCPRCEGTGKVTDRAMNQVTCPRCQNSLAYVSLPADWNSYTLPDGSEVPTSSVGGFGQSLRANAGNIQILTQAILDIHRGQDEVLYWWEKKFAQGEFYLAVEGPPPTPAEFDKLMNPLIIEDVRIAKDPTGTSALRIDYRINDLSLYTVFCREWDKEIEEAVKLADGYFSTWNENPSDLRIPHIHLDEGPVHFNRRDPQQVWPGNPQIMEMWLSAKLKTSLGKIALLRFQTPDGEPVASDGWVPCVVGLPEDGQYLFSWQRKHVRAWGSRSEPLATSEEEQLVWKSRAGRGRVWVPLENPSVRPSQIHVTLSLRDWVSDEPYGVRDNWPDVQIAVEIKSSTNNNTPMLDLIAKQRLPRQSQASRIFDDHIIRASLDGQVRYQHFVRGGEVKSGGLLALFAGLQPFAHADMEFTGIKPGTYRVQVDVVTADGITGATDFDFEVGPANDREYQSRMKAVESTLSRPDSNNSRLRWAHEKRCLTKYYWRATRPEELLPLMQEWTEIAKTILSEPQRRFDKRTPEQLFLEEIAKIVTLYADIGGEEAYRQARALVEHVEPYMTSVDQQRGKSVYIMVWALRRLALESANDVSAAIGYQRRLNQMGRAREDIGTLSSFAVEEAQLTGLPRLVGLEFEVLSPASSQAIAGHRSGESDLHRANGETPVDAPMGPQSRPKPIYVDKRSSIDSAFDAP